MQLSKKFDHILAVMTFVVVLVGGFFVYQLHAKQKHLEQLIPEFCNSASHAEQNLKVERVVETVMRKTSPWAALQPQIKDAIIQVFSQIAVFNWLEPYQTPAQNMSAGTGFFIDEFGHFITNAHVVDQAKAVTVQIPSLGKEQFEAEIVGICYDRDLALLKLKQHEFDRVVEVLGRINYLKIGDSDALQRAEEIMYQGYPLGQQSLKSTVGVVSGPQNDGNRQYIQIDAATNPGCSGGPALNLNGEVVGVLNSGITTAQNVGYIIPANELKVVLKDLYHSHNPLVRRPFLGVLFAPSSPDLARYLGNPVGGGVYVVTVFDESVLSAAGVQSGDMLYEINGYKIDSYGEISVPWAKDKLSLTEYTAYLTIGQQINLVTYRNGEMRLLSFEFVQSQLMPIREMYPDYEKIDYEVIGGFVVMELTLNHVLILGRVVDDLVRFKHPKNRTKPRLLITHVFPASLAQRARVFDVGNIIKFVNEEKVSTLADFRKSLRKSLDTGVLTVKTSQGVLSVFPLGKLLQQELSLSAIYHYPISPTVQDLIQEYSKKHPQGLSTLGAVDQAAANRALPGAVAVV